MPHRPKQLGPYAIGDKLGQGGMGSVYVAFDGEQRAAVKVLAPALACDQGFRTRFEAEIESLKKLSHPNIVRLFAYGEQDGYLYYAMELVEGTSLEDELRQGRRFFWREVTRMSIGVCRALKHAHDHGVIHRDIKPANLLLAAADEQVKISDFGIARMFGNYRMTNEGGVLGTAEYMAPEQADGRPVTDRCDQYSLGGVMYALLTGRPPFRANSLVEMLQLQRFGEPQPLRYFAPDTPLELERIVHQLLSKDPQKRFSNALLLSRALEAMELALSRNLGPPDFIVSTGEPPAVRFASADPLAVTLLPHEAPDPGAITYRQVPTAFADSAVNEAGPLAGPTVRPIAPRPGEPLNAPPGAAIGSRPGEPIASQPGPLIGRPSGGAIGSRPGGPAAPQPALFSLAPAAAEPSPAPVVRFTKVEATDEAPVSGLRDFLNSLVSPQALSLLAGLAMVALAAMWLLKPASADRVYAQIDSLAHSGAAETLFDAEGPIDDFLARFPQDARAGEVAGLREQLELAKMERRMDRAARRSGAADGATSLERAYLEAAHLAYSQPEQALARFRALVDLADLCESTPDSAAHDRQLLELARRQRDRLEDQVNRRNAADRQWAQAELKRAAELARADADAADKIRRAIVELFGGRPALDDIVSEARQALGEHLGSRN